FADVCDVLAERGAHTVPRLSFAGFGPPHPWIRSASDELLSVVSPIEEQVFLSIDALVAIVAPENTREGADIEAHRMQLVQQASHRIQERLISGEVPWLRCQYPTPALAQDAGMTLAQFGDFLYGAVLRDRAGERGRMPTHQELFDRA